MISTTTDIYIKHIEKSLENAELYISKITKELLELDGMSGKKTRHFYNNLLDFPDDVRYLEIGTWKGSSLCSAMYQNTAKIVCIDNFSEFGQVKEEFLQNMEKFKGNNQVHFIEQDCFEVDIKLIPLEKINVYLYDGNHTFESHCKALTHFYDLLDDIFIYIVDDWNAPEIRAGTNQTIKELNFDILYEKEIRTTWDNNHAPYDEAREGWWNGIYIVLLKKM